jgi:GntR family transcriptional regulator
VLSAEGLITSRRGRGTFVCAAQVRLDARLRSAINDPRSGDLRLEILEQRAGVPLPADLAAHNPSYPDYAFIRKIHRHDDAPFCLVEIHVASEIQARFPPGAEARHKIAWLLNAWAADRMHKVQQTLSIAPADLVLARQLDCAFSTPIAHMTRRVFDAAGRIALAGRFWYRGDRFVMDLEIPFDVWVNYPGVVMPETRRNG